LGADFNGLITSLSAADQTGTMLDRDRRRNNAWFTRCNAAQCVRRGQGSKVGCGCCLRGHHGRLRQ
jgi:hypothetical protein